MKSFFKLVLLGAFLVTLLIVIDTIDAGKKERTKRVADCSNWSMKQNGQNGKMSQYYYEYMDNLLKESMLESDEFDFKRATNGDEGGSNSYTRTKRLTDDENIEEKQTRGNDKENKVKERLRIKHKFAEAIFDILDDVEVEEEVPTDDAQRSETVSKKPTEDTEAEPTSSPPTSTTVPPTKEYKVYYDPEHKGPKTLKYTLYEENVDGEVKPRVKVERDGVLECDITPIIVQHFGIKRKRIDKDATTQAPTTKAPTGKKPMVCEPLDFSDLPRTFAFIVEDEKLNGKVKRTLTLDQDGIRYCQMQELMYRYYRLGELQR